MQHKAPIGTTILSILIYTLCEQSRKEEQKNLYGFVLIFLSYTF